MPAKDIKVTQENIWVRLSTLVPVIAITASATLIYVRVESLEKKVDALGVQMQSTSGEHVSVRQMQTLIELMRAVNRDKMPALIIPDLPR
jgi:hypothetical protein